MGWTVSYQIVRERPLDEQEIVKLAELVRRQQKQPWDSESFNLRVPTSPRADGVIADGWNKLSMGATSKDPELAKAAITELHALLGGELRVSDDFRVLGKTAQPIEVTYEELVAVTTLVAAPPVELAATDGVPELMAKLLDVSDADHKLRKPIQDRLAQLDPVEIARFIYRDYARIGKDYGVREVLSAALSLVPDPVLLVPDFLAVWGNPSGTYFYGDMPKPKPFVAVIARDPRVIERMVADVERSAREPTDMPCRCAGAALEILAAGGNVREIVEAVRKRRGKPLSSDERFSVFDRAHRVLASTKDPRVAPTLLSFIGSAKSFGSSRRVLDDFVTFAAERVRPFVLTLAKRGVHRTDCISWLRVVGDQDGLIDALTARGNAPLEERAVDVDLDTRHAALREIHKRKDPSTYVPLVLAELLDKYLRARTDYPGLPFSWFEWKDKLPPGDAVDGTSAAKLKWYELVGKNLLGPQVIWPSVKVIQERGPAAVAADYPSELLDFDAAALAALEREEAEAFGF